MKLFVRRPALMALALGLALALAGCASNGGNDTNNTNNNNGTNGHSRPDCAPSEESGYWLVPIGSLSYDIAQNSTATLKAMVVQALDEETTNHQDGLAAYYPLKFEIISPVGGGDGILNVTDTTTDEGGMVTAEFTAPTSGTYQILLSGAGVCSRQYTVKVMESRPALEPLTSNPSITYTNRRASLGVRAFNYVAGQGEFPLPSRAITFELLPGGTGSVLEEISGTTGSTITVNTDVSGKASLFFKTGSAPYTATIRATLDGEATQPVTMLVEVQAATNAGPCETNMDCPYDAPLCDEGTCIEVTPGGPCQGDEDCTSPYTCQEGTCQPPSLGLPCSPLSVAQPCPEGLSCIGGYCVETPGPCENNDDCPVGYLCEEGNCVPDDGGDDCANVECPDPNDVCVAGNCIPESQCALQDSPTRLGGSWNFDSTLHLREAVHPFLGGFLTATETLRDIIQGNFSINGIPQQLMSIVNGFLQDLIDQYVPQWAQDLIVALGNISDIVDDMRVLHTVNIIPMGNDQYYGSQIWDLVEFEYQGNHVSSPPEDVLGFQVIPQDFTAREICGFFFIDRHYVENVVGGLVSWAIDVVVTGVTCASGNTGCYYSLEDALEDLIDCDAIATAIDDLVYSMFDWAPSVYTPIFTVCDNNKQTAIDSVLQALNNIEVSLNLLSLTGRSPIVDDSHMSPGRWYGTLAGGNFNGEFTAVKQ